MHDLIDLRSDTVTKPTAAMRQAMRDAAVGDDVYRDDPTVERLQQRAAERAGKEAALFVPSGTMANNIAIKVHTQPGDEILVDWDSHTLCYELGAAAVLSGVQTRQFRSDHGVPMVDEVVDAMRTQTIHSPGTALVVLENTHNRAGGAVIPLDVHQGVYVLAKERGIRVHIDGARIFNAEVASGIPVSEYASQADSICFCLSKGLGCPVGSVLCGTREFIEQARRVRKMFGGGMRQAGVLAACGLLALDTMVDRLQDDHKNARRLAEGLASLGGVSINLDSVQTNMVYVHTDRPADELTAELARRHVLCNSTASHDIRLVTHLDIDADDVGYTINAFREVLVEQ